MCSIAMLLRECNSGLLTRLLTILEHMLQRQITYQMSIIDLINDLIFT